jgi:hypothetical protein
MMNRRGPEHIGTAGASAGDALLHDPDQDEYVPGDAVLEIVEGDGVSIDATDPKRPIVSAAPPPPLIPLTSKTVTGDASLVWGGLDDDELIYTEGP